MKRKFNFKKTKIVNFLMALVLFAIGNSNVVFGHPTKGNQKKTSNEKVEEGYIPTDDGTRLFYQKIGKGKQTVIIPGRLFVFDDLKQLANGRTLIFYDMRGRGRSDMIPDDKRSQIVGIYHDVKDVERVRKHFNIE